MYEVKLQVDAHKMNLNQVQKYLSVKIKISRRVAESRPV